MINIFSRDSILAIVFLFLLSCSTDDPTLPDVVADFTMSKETVNEGENITFTDKSIGTPTQWEWSFEGGSPGASSDQNPIVTYEKGGIYKVTLNANNGQKVNSISKYVQIVFPNIIVGFSANKTNIYEGDTILFVDETLGTPSSWLWSFEGGNPFSTNDQSPEVIYNSIGQFSVSLSANNDNKFGTLVKNNYVTVENILEKGLIAYYKLDGNVNDETGNQNPGTVFDNAIPIEDRFGNINSAYEFNNGRDRIEIGTNYTFNNSYSLFCWVKMNSLLSPKSHYVFSVDGTLAILLRNPEGLRVVLDDLDGNQLALNSSGYAIFEDFNWHMIGFTYNGDELKLFVDGELKSSMSGSVNISGLSDVASIGNINLLERPLYGAIDDFRVYSRALSDSEVLNLYSY